MDDSRNLYHCGERPAEKDRGTGWEIVRPKNPKPDTIAIVSHKFFPLRIHHFRGATIPCRLEGCPACAKGERSRWRAYMLGVVAQSRRRVIMEASAEVEPFLDNLITDYTTLRGCVVIFTRTKPTDRAKHHMTFVKKLDDETALPEDRDVWPIICRIFGLEQFVSPTQGEKTLEDVAELVTRRDARGQRALRRNTAPEIETICNSGEERDLVESILQNNLANGNGRPARK